MNQTSLSKAAFITGAVGMFSSGGSILFGVMSLFCGDCGSVMMIIPLVLLIIGIIAFDAASAMMVSTKTHFSASNFAFILVILYYIFKST